MRRIGVGAMLVLALVVGACGSSGPVELTADDSGEEVSIRTGDRIELRLESNASTGYEWYIEGGQVPDGLRLVDSGYEEPESDLVGAPGTQVWEFEATAEGAGVLRLVYLRLSDDPPVADRVVEYVIRVDRAPWPPDDASVPGTSTDSAP